MATRKQIERELLLFSEGLSGNIPKVLEPTEDHASSLKGTTGSLILPNEIKVFGDQRDLGIYLWLTLQQLAFREFGTFRFDIEEARERISYLNQKVAHSNYLATDLDQLFGHFEQKSLAGVLFYYLELYRIERPLLKRYPGAQKLRLLAQRWWLAATNTAESALALPLHQFVLGLAGALPLEAWAHRSIQKLRQKESSVFSTVEVLVECYQNLVLNLGLAPQEIESDLAQFVETLDVMERQSRLEDWEHQLDDLTSLFDEAAIVAGGDGNVVATDSQIAGTLRDTQVVTKHEKDQLERRIEIEKSSLMSATSHDGAQKVHFFYDEWNYLEGRMLKRWVRLFEESPNPSDESRVGLMRERIRPHIPIVRRYFEQLKPTGIRRLRHQRDGDEFDVDQLIATRVDLRAGRFADDRIYSTRAPMVRDVSTLLLVDLSASTDDPVEEVPSKAGSQDTKPQDLRDPFFDEENDPYLHGSYDFAQFKQDQTPMRRVIDVQLEAVLLLALALQELHDLFSVCGFSGYSREEVQIVVAKDFDDPLDDKTVNAIANMKPMRSTRMGPAIRHSIFRLNQTGSRQKILVVLSDGFPQDCDYGPDRSDHEYGIQDTAKALEEAHRAGVQAFCITVDRSGHDYLKRMCPASSYMVIEEIDDLPDALQRVYQQLSTG